MIEKRDATRIPYRCEVGCEEVESGARPPNPMIADLSTTGIFVDTTVVFSKGAIVTLNFTLRSLVMCVKAEVAHPMPTMGMGLRFLDLTPAQIAALEGVVESHEAERPVDFVGAASPAPA